MRSGAAGFSLIMLFSVTLFPMPSYDDVLLVIKSGDAVSAEIGAYFKSARKIPDSNVATIALPGWGATKVTMAERDRFIADIHNYIAVNGLVGKINYIVLSSGFPTKGYDDAGGTRWSMLDTYMMLKLSAAYPTSSWCTNNPYAYVRKDNYTNRSSIKFTRNKYGYYIVTRLDGPSSSAIKKMIDNFGPSVFNSAASVKYVIDSMAQYTGSSANQHHPEIQANIEARGGAFILWKTNDGFVHDCSDINFLDADWVYGADAAYSRASVIQSFPHQWKRLSFKPGSVMQAYRSFSTGDGYFATSQFGLHLYNAATVKSMMQADGSDFEVMNMTAVVVNPEDNTVWCGTGIHPRHEWVSTYDYISADYMRRHGAGIAVYNKTGALVSRITSDNGLLCNAVYTLVYDKYNHRIWAGTFSGVCYYDIGTRTWITPAGLSHPDGARVEQIYVDPTTSGQYVYVTYTYGYTGTRVPNRLASWQRIFEHAVSTGTTTVRDLGISDTFWSAHVAKSEPDIIWLRYATNNGPNSFSYIRKIRISTGQKLYELSFNDINGVDYSPAVSYSTSGQNIIIVTNGSEITAYSPIGTTNAVPSIKNGVLRIIDGAAPSAVVWGAAGWWNSTMPNVGGAAVMQNPLHPEKVYLITREKNALKSYASGKLIEFSAANTAGTEVIGGGNPIYNVNDAVFDNEVDGRIWFVRYQYASTGQYALYELFNYGLAGAMGGFTHDWFYYDGNSLNVYSVPASEYIATAEADYHLYTAESGGAPMLNGMYQLKSMAMLLLDGFYFAEARFGSLAVYPTQGSGGHNSFMIVMDPKAAPYAPRVDLAGTDYHIRRRDTNSYSLSALLTVPTALPVNRSFLAATVNSSTVKLLTAEDTELTVESIALSNAGSSTALIVTTKAALSTNGSYRLRLACGVNGIKCATGASLVNTRTDEFSDVIDLAYTVIDAEPPSPFPAQVRTPWVQNNPYRSGSGISFMDVSDSATIDIYTVSGRLIASLPPAAGARMWDVCAKDGRRVAPGVYICRIVSGGSAKVTKVMVMR